MADTPPPAPMTAERLEEIRRELIPSDEWLAANQSDPWVASEVEVAKTVRPLFAHIAALTARVAELEGGLAKMTDGWRTTDSAPKDGTEIIGLWRYGARWFTRALYWDGAVWVDPHSDFIYEPTHWAPPPKD